MKKKTLNTINIIINGEPGTGKSMVRNCIIQSLIDISIKNKRKARMPEFEVATVGEHNLAVNVKI